MQDIKYSEIPKGFTGFIFAPGNEKYEVVMLFSMVLPHLKPPMCIKEASDKFPDCTVIRWDAKGPKEMKVEIEKNARDFLDHNHDIKRCDILVCWENDWGDCPMEIIELKSEIRKLPFTMVLKPNEYLHIPTKGNVESYFQAVGEKSTDTIRDDQKKLYNYLSASPILSAIHGTGKKNESYTIKAGRYSLGYVQADGPIELYFLGPKHSKSPLPDQLREAYRGKAEKILNTDTGGKPWKKVGILSIDLSFAQLKQLLDWVAHEIGKTKGDKE